MKALELLLQYQYADEIGGEMMKYELDEAIAELEELMKPKSCEGCVRNDTISRWCACCVRNDYVKDNYFKEIL